MPRVLKLARPIFLLWILSLAIHSVPAATSSQAGTDIQIAFWNIRDLSTNNRTVTELRQIAQVIHRNDCVAICEINDTKVLKLLCDELKSFGGKWASAQTPRKVGNTKPSAEYYGFVFRSDKLKRVGSVRILPEKVIGMATATVPYHFDRDPAVCRFKTKDGRFDFTLMVAHVTWGKGVEYRKAEIRALKDYFIDVQGEDDENDLILTGDFNRNVNDPGSLMEVLSVSTMIDVTDGATPTKIDTANTYDHMLFQTMFVREYTGAHGVTKFDEELFADDDEQARVACSDHRPVWARFRVPVADDD